MPVLVEISGLVTGVIVVLILTCRVPVAMLIQITWCVTGMIVVLAWNLPLSCVSMPVLVKIARLMAGMVMVRTRLFLRHR